MKVESQIPDADMRAAESYLEQSSANPQPASPDIVAGSVPADRNSSLDVCRIFASISLLWMHTWESGHLGQVGEIGRFGVPFFTSAAFYLLMQSFYRRPNRPFIPYLKNRFLRLYVPFLAWGLVGLLTMSLKHRFISHQPMGIDASFLLTGASFQLWYLPFLFLASLLFYPLCRWSAGLSHGSRLALGSVLFIAGIVIAMMPNAIVLEPASSWFECQMFALFSWNALPSAFCGMAIALCLKHARVVSWIGWIGLAVTVAGSAFVAVTYRNILLETATGSGLLLFAISDRRVQTVSRYSRFAFLAYGIYLSQNVILEPIQTVLTRVGILPSPGVEVVVFAVALSATVAISVILNRSSKTRWMIG